MATIAERVRDLTDKSDELCHEIKEILHEIESIDGVESIEHLADAPSDLKDAAKHTHRATVALLLAWNDTRKGGL